MHLNSGELVDIAEGLQPESSVPHLVSCDACRVQLRELRTMLSAAHEVDVPEPSPLFWDHLSARVTEAIAAEPSARSSWIAEAVAAIARALSTRAFQASAAAAAAMLLVVLLTDRTAPSPAPSSIGASPAASVETGVLAEPLVDVATADDASLTVVASLTDGQDLETVREAGLAPRGAAEHAVTHMNESELRELGRLLQEELARSGP